VAKTNLVTSIIEHRGGQSLASIHSCQSSIHRAHCVPHILYVYFIWNMFGSTEDENTGWAL